MPDLPLLPGIALKPEHYATLLADGLGAAPVGISPHCPAWVEVHPQNYFCGGGPPHRWLTAVAERFPLSFHSVGLSLGSAGGLIEDELASLAALCKRYEPVAVSEHLSWSGTEDERYPDLLPLPYTTETLDHFAAQVARMQDRLGRKVLIENPSRYLAFAHDTMDEAGFLTELCRRSGCGLLLDVNNIEVSATNLGLDPFAMVDAIDSALVGEIHLAGHKREEHADGPLLIDDHGSPVSELTWRLFERFIARVGPRPALIEWDTDIPALEVLVAEAARAGRRMARRHAKLELADALA